VNVIDMSTFDRLRMLPVAPPRSTTRERYERVFRPIYVPKLRSLIRGKDVVHAVCGDYYGWAAEEAARAEGVPFVLTPYVHPGDQGDDPANVDFYKRADIVFALIETGAQKLIQLGVPPERLRLSGVVPLLPHHVDPRGFRRRHGLDDKPVVLFIGRMVEYKGCLAILNAAKRVWREMPDVQFLFAGPAGTRQAQWVAELGDRRARYLGLISDQEKGDALAACDPFCMPSTAEILPAVYLEAWSYGKAVIGGTADGLRELIEDNGGGVIVEQNPDVLAAQAIDLLRNESRRRRMGECGRALVERRFSENAVVGAMERSLHGAVPGLSCGNCLMHGLAIRGGDHAP
jgi:glycosyltransferase involved in cell wall biosynthesis